MVSLPARPQFLKSSDHSEVFMEIPCLVIGGFLGSGKTTYLNSLLRGANGLKLGVLVNDFGDVPIDYDLIESAHENVLELTGGCVCCTYGGDLVSALTQMIAKPSGFDALIVETSGLSLPGIVAASIRLVPGISRVGVLGLVDGVCFSSNIADKFLSDTIVRQIQESDLILLTKLAPDDHAKQTETEAILAKYSSDAEVVTLLPPGDIFDWLFNGNGFAEKSGKPLQDSIFSRALSYPKAKAPLVTSITLVLSDTYHIEMVLKGLQSLTLPIIRSKGIFRAESNRYAVVDFAGLRWSVEYRADAPTRPGMTFFLSADAEQKDQITAQILNVFDAAAIN